MTNISNRKATSDTQAFAKVARARSEIANLSADQLKDAGIDVSGIPCSPTFAVDARTMTSLMALR